MFSWFIHVVAVSVLCSFLLPNNIPYFGYTQFYLYIHQLMDSWMAFTFWLLWTMLLWTFVYQILCARMFSHLLDIYIRVELLGHMETLCLTFWRTAIIFFEVASPFCMPTSNAWGLLMSPHPHQHLLSVFFILSILVVWSGISLRFELAFP